MPIGTPTTPILMVGGASAVSFNTGDYTPPANCVLVAFVTARGTSAEEPTISDTGGTWDVIASSFIDGGGQVGKLWKMDIGASPPTLNTTAGSVGATQTAIAVTDFPGGAVSAASIQTGTSSTGDPAVTMGAFGANSAGFGCAGVSGGDARPPPTGYTELNDSAPATNVRLHVAYDLTSPGTDISWSGAGVSAVALGLEIVEVGSGAQNISGALFTNTQTFHAAALAVNIAGVLFTNSQTFFGATIALGGATQNIDGALYTDPDIFYNAEILGGTPEIGALMAITLLNDTFAYQGRNGGFREAQLIAQADVLPAGSTFVNADSGNVANALASAVLPAVVGRTNYITGFEVTGAGATAGLPVIVDVAGLLGGTLSYIYAFKAGVLVGNDPLVVQFNPPLPASGVNTPIQVTCPAGGAGNTHNAVVVHGFHR